MQIFDQLEPFQMASFFELHFDLVKEGNLPKKESYVDPYLLPDTSELISEVSFSEVAMCYNEKGLCIKVLVHKPFENTNYTQFAYGDCIELFFDTRDIKSARIIHKFCHHFVFFPKPEQEVSALEVTQFRGEDSHTLCDHKLLHVETTFHKTSYEMDIFIENTALFGFDPQRFQRLGFCYRINRKNGDSQNFNVSSKSYSFEKHPNLWASFNLAT